VNEEEAYAWKVFDIKETGLPWACMPCCTFFFIEKKTVCGLKVAKDHFMLLLGSNASN
jgi:hypothetical protein